MAKKATNELYALEVESTRGRRERAWPEGGFELVDFETAVERIHQATEAVKKGAPVEGHAAQDIGALALVEVVVEGDTATARDVEVRRRAWGWSDKAVGRKSRRAVQEAA